MPYRFTPHQWSSWIARGLAILAFFWSPAAAHSFAAEKPAKAADKDEPKYLQVLHDSGGDATALENGDRSLCEA